MDKWLISPAFSFSICKMGILILREISYGEYSAHWQTYKKQNGSNYHL